MWTEKEVLQFWCNVRRIFSLTDYLNSWSAAERQTFNDKIRLYHKNFHALSHFFWNKVSDSYYFCLAQFLKF